LNLTERKYLILALAFRWRRNLAPVLDSAKSDKGIQPPTEGLLNRPRRIPLAKLAPQRRRSRVGRRKSDAAGARSRFQNEEGPQHQHSEALEGMHAYKNSVGNLKT